jgi:hypothetical protein
MAELEHAFEGKRVQKVSRVVTFEHPLFLAVQETVQRLQDSGLEIDRDTFIQLAVARELQRREVTWWESRISKALRVISGLQSK